MGVSIRWELYHEKERCTMRMKFYSIPKERIFWGLVLNGRLIF